MSVGSKSRRKRAETDSERGSGDRMKETRAHKDSGTLAESEISQSEVAHSEVADSEVTTTAAAVILDAAQLDSLIDALAATRRRVIGPQVRDGVITYEPLTSVSQLPFGVVDDQEPGRYRLTAAKKHSAYFDFTLGPQGWKRYLMPPHESLFSLHRDGKTWAMAPTAPGERYVFFGVRPCELSAMEAQDQVLKDGPYAVPSYSRRRRAALTVVVNCRRAAATCFCASPGKGGPRATAGYDLALSELRQDQRHVFLLEAGSPAGQRVLERLALPAAADSDHAAVRKQSEKAAAAQARAMPKKIRRVLAASLDSPRWQQIAERCLSCGSCTLVCPTCFCHSTVDATSLDGSTAERARQWDSCFNLDFSYIHGGAIRRNGAERFRQWMTHKLSSWHEQFGRSGCVGCGRCITWCPVGIDITAEAKAFAAKSGKKAGGKGKPKGKTKGK